jgi:hypothetical protein
MRPWPLLGALFLLAAGPPAQGETAGAWRVNGAISGRTFVLDCRLEDKVGVCADASRGGKVHSLTSLSRVNDQVRWSFSTRVVLLSVTLAFNGRIEGNRMSGVVTAAGRTGSFTAVRS